MGEGRSPKVERSMASKFVIRGLVFLLICFALEDGAKGRKLSVEDDELESQLQLINKPSIKTIKNEYGDIIDCVEIHLQPAFDHNSSKNHTSQRDSKNQSDSSVMYSLAELRSEQCPSGSIPIRRSEKDDIIRWKYLSSKLRSQSKILHPLDSTPKTHWALLQSHEGKYHGASAWLNIAGLPQVESDQLSETSISMMRGAGKHYNIITAGWMVNPMLYGDNQTRLTIFWKTSGDTYCYNHLCPGFHQTSTKMELGAVLSDQGDDKFLTFSLYKEYETGNWWFAIIHRTGEEKIGYWPNSIFTTLKDYATYIQWGGIADSPSNKKSPPMGNGRFASNNGARVMKIEMMDDNGEPQLPTGADTFLTDRPECYNTSKLIYDQNFNWWYFRFGGPGGCLG